MKKNTYIDLRLYAAYPAFQEAIQELQQQRWNEFEAITPSLPDTEGAYQARQQAIEMHEAKWETRLQALIEEHQAPLFQPWQQAIEATGCAIYCDVAPSYPHRDTVEMSIARTSEEEYEIRQTIVERVPVKTFGKNCMVHFQVYSDSWVSVDKIR